MRTALVTVAHGRHAHLERQREMVGRSRRRPDDQVLVAMADSTLSRRWAGDAAVHLVELPAGGSGLPLAAARNAGAAAALGRGAELLVFLDVDCLPGSDLLGRYAEAAADPEVGDSLLCGPVAYLTPPPDSGYDLNDLPEASFHPARPVPGPEELQRDGDHRLFWSLSFATTAATWHRIGGFDEAYEGYGAEDTDFGCRARAAGVPLTWVGGAAALHQWHPSESPPENHLDDILRNGAIFARRWGWWPMEGWLAAFVERGLIRWDDAARRYVRTTGPMSVTAPSGLR